MNTDDPDPMWYCPECEAWIGWTLEECSEGHDRPRFPVTTEDVDAEDASDVTVFDRMRVVARRVWL